ncbi:MAG TPA: hypothetical protein VN873_16290 [Candidatus Angelobacter sp.]|nr:hypothetical protein [Candidatus Angelobacter sp.]
MNTLTLNPKPTRASVNQKNTSANFTDISRGAQILGLRGPRVFVASDVLDDYCELHFDRGWNLAGVILSGLKIHLEHNPGGTYEDQFRVCAIRRDDAAPVVMNFQIERTRRAGTEHILLLKGDEQRIIDATEL